MLLEILKNGKGENPDSWDPPVGLTPPSSSCGDSGNTAATIAVTVAPQIGRASCRERVYVLV